MRDTDEKRIGSEFDMNEKEFQRSLVSAEMVAFAEAHRSDKPKAIYMIAQPGAGKTGLKTFIVNEVQNNGGESQFIEFNPDQISTHHKYYSEIIEKYPDDSYRILQRFTSVALDEYLRQKAVEIRCNIMQEGTFNNIKGYVKILDFQKHGGKAEIGNIQEDGKRSVKYIEGDYEVEINAMAVNRYESLLSCFEREQDLDEMHLPPRAVTIQNHDNAYNNMLETISIVEREKLFDKMRVFKRGYVESRPELIYVAGDSRFPSVVEAIKAERLRQERELFNNPLPYYERIEKLNRKAENYQNFSLVHRLSDLKEIFTKDLEEHKKEKERE